ncbi:MAG: DUF192 domain-containing protein [Treponema sp.]|nr:DUF192 domain-containing protein [Treponema sp.]
MRIIVRIIVTSVAMAAMTFSACAGSGKDANGIPTSPNPTLPTATFAIGKATIVAELARTADQRERGLMFRKSLADGRGMLFVFDSDQVLTFWMKNTYVPLSIAWIGSDGYIKGLSDMDALSLAPVGSDRSVRYALEVPRGWFDRAGVQVGDKVALPAGLSAQP